MITLSSARSGTTFCYSLTNTIYNGFVRVEHEIIKGREARLREFFRCYEAERISEAFAVTEGLETTEAWLVRPSLGIGLQLEVNILGTEEWMVV